MKREVRAHAVAERRDPACQLPRPLRAPRRRRPPLRGGVAAWREAQQGVRVIETNRQPEEEQ